MTAMMLPDNIKRQRYSAMKKTMLVILALIFTMTTAALAADAAPEAQKAPQQYDYARVAVAIEQVGVNYTKISKTTWRLDIPVDEKTTQNIYLIADKDIISVILPLMDTPSPLSADLTAKLAALNSDYYLVKFSYDAKRLYARVDCLLGTLSGQSLAEYIVRVNRSVAQVTPDLQKLTGAATDKKPVK